MKTAASRSATAPRAVAPSATSANFHEPSAHDDVAPPSPRQTGIVFIVVALIAAWFGRNHPLLLQSMLALAGLLALLVLLRPQMLERVSYGWFRFGLLLNTVMSPLVMLILFAGAIVPYGLAMQRLRDPLQKRRDPAARSYWIERTQKPAAMTRQF